MNDIPTINISAILKQYGLRVDKKLGQNFLHDSFALEAIASAAEIKPSDIVLEIGPGLGSLTRYLARDAHRVIAVELDEELIPPLEETTTGYGNIEIIHGNILDIHPKELRLEPGYLVVANIPYYITSAIIRHLLENEPKPRRLVLTVQKEVAKRICAQPGNMSLLALSVQVYGDPKIVKNIPAGSFFPEPRVDSAVLRVDIHPFSKIKTNQIATFFKLIKAGFSQKRKTLRNTLSSGLHISTAEAEMLLEEAGIDHMRRAETLSIEEWGRLCTHK